MNKQLEELFEQRIAVSITSFNRPNYLQDEIRSLENCVDKHRVDWVFLQDGAVNKFSGERKTEQSKIDQSINVIEQADLPNKRIVEYDHNLGQAISLDRTLKLSEDYDVIIHLDNDFIISKYFVRVALSLLDEYPQCVPSLYRTVDASQYNIPHDLNHVIRGDHAKKSVFAITEEQIDIITEEWNNFMKVARGIDWEVNHRLSSEEVVGYFEGDCIACDTALNNCISNNNLYNILLRVSRSSHIGKHGQNNNPAEYERRGFGNEGKLHYGWDQNPGDWQTI